MSDRFPESPRRGGGGLFFFAFVTAVLWAAMLSGVRGGLPTAGEPGGFTESCPTQSDLLAAVVEDSNVPVEGTGSFSVLGANNDGPYVKIASPAAGCDFDYYVTETTESAAGVLSDLRANGWIVEDLSPIRAVKTVNATQWTVAVSQPDDSGARTVTYRRV